MFEDSLFDSSAGTRPHKTWPKMISYFAEVCAVGILVLLPLIYTQALPKQQLMSFLEAPSPPPGRAPVQAEQSQPRVRPRIREQDDSVLHEPGYIPRTISLARDEPVAEGPPSMDGLVQGGIANGVPNAVLTEMARRATDDRETCSAAETAHFVRSGGWHARPANQATVS